MRRQCAQKCERSTKIKLKRGAKREIDRPRQNEMDRSGCGLGLHETRHVETNAWNIKKHEISWSKRNSPNYYNLANVCGGASAYAVFEFERPYLSIHNIFCRFPTLIYCFVCINYFRSIYLSKWLLLHVPTAVCLTFASFSSSSSVFSFPVLLFFNINCC